MARHNNSPVPTSPVTHARRRVRHPLTLFAAAVVAFAAVLLYGGREDPAVSDVLQRVRHAAADGARFARALAGTVPYVRQAASDTPRASTARAGDAVDETGSPFAASRSGVAEVSPGARGLGIGGATYAESGATAATGEGTAAASSGTNAQDGTSGEFAAFGGGPAPGGVTPQQAQSQLAKVARGLSAGTQGGVLVSQVLASSVARMVGLQPGDLIMAVNGQPINSPAEFAQLYEQDGMPRQIDAVRNGRAIHLHP